MYVQGNGQDLNDETPGGDQETKKVKKEGFFSSIGNIVSDFTENIIKDLQGEEERSGKISVSNFPSIKIRMKALIVIDLKH
jgi:hypothetical protein